MMDQGRTEKELQEIFGDIQRSYEALLEDGFMLQEKAFEFARRLLESSAEAQSVSNRNALDALIEQSRGQRKASEDLAKSSAGAFATVLEAPYAHDHKVEEAKAVLEEASPESGKG